MVVPVLMTSCQVSEKRNMGPVTAQPMMTRHAAKNTQGEPVNSEAACANFRKRSRRLDAPSLFCADPFILPFGCRNVRGDVLNSTECAVLNTFRAIDSRACEQRAWYLIATLSQGDVDLVVQLITLGRDATPLTHCGMHRAIQERICFRFFRREFHCRGRLIFGNGLPFCAGRDAEVERGVVV
jgi:hypothetical protein